VQVSAPCVMPRRSTKRPQHNTWRRVLGGHTWELDCTAMTCAVASSRVPCVGLILWTGLAYEGLPTAPRLAAYVNRLSIRIEDRTPRYPRDKTVRRIVHMT
jgi:hypothetical protein